MIKRIISCAVVALGCALLVGCARNPLGQSRENDPKTTESVSQEDTELLPEGDVISIYAYSLPGDYHFSFSDSESIKNLKDYFDTLDLESDYPEKAEDYSGMTWVLEFTYSDQRTETIYHSGNMFVRNMNGSKWYKMKYEQAAKLEDLLGFEYHFYDVSDEEYNEICQFMNYFMTFPVAWDFDQQDMSGAVDYFAQKWVWTDVTDLEYDAEENAFSVDADVFAEKMGQYFVMSDSALKSMEGKAQQGRLKIYADKYLPWFWGFSFRFDIVDQRNGGYYVHGYNTEIKENRARNDGTAIETAVAEKYPFELAVLCAVRGEDGRLRLLYFMPYYL